MDTVGCMLSRLSSFVVITSCLAVSLAAVGKFPVHRYLNSRQRKRNLFTDFLEVEEVYPSITRQKRSADAVSLLLGELLSLLV